MADLLRKLFTSFKALSAERKAAFVLLMILGVGGFAFGFQSFAANIRRPFEIQIASYTGEQFLTSSQKEEQDKEEMKTRDTDSDGLVDYDETYVFKTSPYLSDTDSDGFDDKTEAYSGNDPNCPEGKDCGHAIASLDAAGNVSADPANLLGTLPNSPFSRGFENLDLNSEDQLMAFFNAMSIEDVRAALVQSGIPKEKLDGMDDDTVRKVFNDAVSQASSSGQFSALVNQLQGQAEAQGVSTTIEEGQTP